jgi:hypothetical protein
MNIVIDFKVLERRGLTGLLLASLEVLYSAL